MNTAVGLEELEMEPSLVADSLGVEKRHEASSDGDMFLDRALVISDPEFPNTEREYLDWQDPDIDFADLLNLPEMNDDESVQYPSSSGSWSSSLVCHSTPSTDQTVQVQQVISSPNLSIPRLPTSTLRSLSPRTKMKTGQQKSRIPYSIP
ncbi:uncharacterized protein PAC_08106 [Phialocephala subalpina]|uniref:Uncharacterized protein n=1 Tax=Phialocephala subalpina TaxID=576137 RepID=A0A1L7WZL1_9HELO|nr:uncharacterized protein PAC_08106 [Phialocephala subalpina]